MLSHIFDEIRWNWNVTLTLTLTLCLLLSIDQTWNWVTIHAGATAGVTDRGSLSRPVTASGW